MFKQSRTASSRLGESDECVYSPLRMKLADMSYSFLFILLISIFDHIDIVDLPMRTHMCN